MSLEKNFRRRVMAFLKPYEIEGNLFVFSVQNIAVRGIPDLHICLKGRYISLELKAEKGRPSKLQMRFTEKVRKAGGYGLILYPKDLEDFKTFIKEELEK